MAALSFVRRSKWLSVALLGLLLGVGLQLMSRRNSFEAPAARDGTALPSGPEIVFLYLGSAACAYSDETENIETVARAKGLLSGTAREEGFGFSTHGIATDSDLGSGLAHLAKLGAWDEVSLGRSWANSDAIRHFFQGSLKPVVTPGIVVFFRRMEPELRADGLLTGYRILRGRVLMRAYGIREIKEWVGNGAPVSLDGLEAVEPP